MFYTHDWRPCHWNPSPRRNQAVHPHHSTSHRPWTRQRVHNRCMSSRGQGVTCTYTPPHRPCCPQPHQLRDLLATVTTQPSPPTQLIGSVAHVEEIYPYNRNNIKVLLFSNSFLGESNQNTFFTIFLIGYAHWNANKIRIEFCSISNYWPQKPLIFL